MECKKYFDNNSKEIDLPNLKATISIIDPNPKGEAALEVGKIKRTTKITVPDTVTSELIRLDQLQFSTCNSIKLLRWWQRGKAKRKKEFIDILLNMLKLSTKNIEETNITNSERNIGVNQTITENSFNNKDLKKYLDERNFKSVYLPDNLSSDPGFIIWPVKLLPSITYIHNAQMQLIKLFVKVGWKLLVIIGDCGKHENAHSSEDFSKSIIKILEKNDIPIEENTVAFLSEYYQRDDSLNNNRLVRGVTSTNLLNTFHSISDGMAWEKFSVFIKKNYDEKKQDEISKRSVLSNIRSLLTWSVAATIVKENEENKPKAIIVAGEDEFEQWEYIAQAHSNTKMGVIFIHELKKNGNKTMDQTDFIIRNIKEMQDKLNSGNMAEWLYTHFIELPKFLVEQKPHFCKASKLECEKYNNNCLKCLFGEGNNFAKDTFDKNEFVKTIYPIANPAN